MHVPNFRRLTRARESCGCTDCVGMHRLHNSLVHWRARHMRKLKGAARDAYKPYVHAKPSIALTEGLPPECRACHNGVRPAACWMGLGTCKCGGLQSRYGG